MPTGGTRATGRGWVGGVCFAYFQPGVRKALTESPVVCWGSELGFLMTTLRNMFSFASSPAMLWLLGWIPIDVEDKEKSHHSASIPVWRRWISRATKVADIWYLYICYSTFRHVDDNQLLSNAPWLSCSIHPKPIIMPIHGDDKETCVCVEYDFHHLGGLMVGRTIMLCGCKRSVGALNSCLRAKPVFL